MFIFEMPFAAQEWANSIPAWLIAFGFLTGVGVWAAKQLGLVKNNGNTNGASGSKDPAFWQKEFRAAVMEVNSLQMAPWLEKLTDGQEKLIDAHEEVVKLLRERSSVFTRQTDLLQELVDANRRRRR